MAKKMLKDRNYNFSTDNENNQEFIQFEKHTLVEIPLSMIEIGENIRDPETDEKLEELGQTIKEYGQLQPCIVYQKGEKYYIKVGSRRFKACSEIGKETLLCIVEDDFEDEKDRIIRQAIENEHRKEMTPREREAYIAQLIDMGLSAADIARLLHKSRGFVSEILGANKVYKENQEIISKIQGNEEIPTRVMYNLKDLPKEKIAETVTEIIKSSGDSKENFNKKIKELAEKKKAENQIAKKDEITDEDFSFDINIGESEKEYSATDTETDINETDENSDALINVSLTYHYTLDEKNKVFKLTTDIDDLDSDIEKFVLRQIKNYYIGKNFRIE